MSEYRVIFFDDVSHRPHIALSKFDGDNGLQRATEHACLLADTWHYAQVVEVVARISGNMKRGALRYEIREG